MLNMSDQLYIKKGGDMLPSHYFFKLQLCANDKE